MSTTSKFARAFSLRDKKGTSHKPFSETNPFSPDDNNKKQTKDEQQKIQDIASQLSRLGNNDVPESRIQHALRSKSANGDIKEALRLLLLYEDSVAGVLRSYDPTIKMLGAENWEKTTCWLDTVLFAMFAKTDVFEAVLHQQYEDESKKQMVIMLRLWVNLLRSGKLIPIDLTRRLQQAIADCGWPDAAKARQQDASEAFNFITDKLSLPLLTLKTDIYHQGKEDANDDHKFITERMLDVAIPEDLPQGEVVKLETCLEEYFNNRVEVKRHLARRNTANSVLSNGHSAEKDGAMNVEVTEIDTPRSNSPAPPEGEIKKPTPQRPFQMRHRATSIFSERKVLKISSATGSSLDEKIDGEQQTGTKKEVLMPAWQFLNLIPWYTDNVPEGDSQVRKHFSHKRLMLGICLKRYGMTKNGHSYRMNTHIDVPLELASPHFTTGGESDSEGTDPSNFKLALQSFVCHRGHSVDGGHYIAFFRVEAPTRDHRESFAETTTDRQPDSSHDMWLKFDDLAVERITRADVDKALREESPYLLFYRVQAIKGVMPDETPPPYQESETSLDLVDQKLMQLEEQAPSRLSTEQPSSRPSIEVTRADSTRHRPSLPERRSSSRAQSTTDGSIVESHSAELLSSENSTRGSPALSKQHTRARSDGRQSDEINRRFSMSMSKLAAKLSRDKLNSPDIVVNEIANEPAGQQTGLGIEEPIIAAHTTNAPLVRPVSARPMPVVKEVSARQEQEKEKEKKKKFRIHGRKGSVGNASNSKPSSGKPDRECALM